IRQGTDRKRWRSYCAAPGLANRRRYFSVNGENIQSEPGIMIWPAQQAQRDRESAPGDRAAPANRNSDNKGTGLRNMPPRRVWLTFVMILVVNYFLARFLFPNPDAPITVPYTAFKEEAAKGNVKAIYSKGASIEGRFAKPVTWPPAGENNAVPGHAARVAPRTADTFTTEL